MSAAVCPTECANAFDVGALIEGLNRIIGLQVEPQESALVD